MADDPRVMANKCCAAEHARTPTRGWSGRAGPRWIAGTHAAWPALSRSRTVVLLCARPQHKEDRNHHLELMLLANLSKDLDGARAILRGGHKREVRKSARTVTLGVTVDVAGPQLAGVNARLLWPARAFCARRAAT